jgi:pimeloyl-ACP methyl ester carboxylesterase
MRIATRCSRCASMPVRVEPWTISPNIPSLILVDGACCYRGMGQSGQLAELLARHFTVFTYDRRGRGGSSDTAPYAVEREIEDIAALLNVAGGAAFVWGTSSGAVLALEAATRLSGIQKLALYEAPLILDGSRSTTEKDWLWIGKAVAADRRSDAVKLFLRSALLPSLSHSCRSCQCGRSSKLLPTRCPTMARS